MSDATASVRIAFSLPIPGGGEKQFGFDVEMSDAQQLRLTDAGSARALNNVLASYATVLQAAWREQIAGLAAEKPQEPPT